EPDDQEQPLGIMPLLRIVRPPLVGRLGDTGALRRRREKARLQPTPEIHDDPGVVAQQTGGAARPTRRSGLRRLFPAQSMRRLVASLSSSPCPGTCDPRRK